MAWGDVGNVLFALAYPQGFKAVQGALDNSQYKTDLEQFGKAPDTYLPDPSRYHDPETGMKILDHFQKKASVPTIDQFRTGYESLTGTADPRFYGDAESRAELAKAGMVTPQTGKNPYVDKALEGFRTAGQQEQTLKAAAGGDPWAAAQIGADKDLASSAHLAAQAVDIPIKRDQAAQKEAREQQKLDAAESKLADTTADQSAFDQQAAGIGGSYTPAQPLEGYTVADKEYQWSAPTADSLLASPAESGVLAPASHVERKTPTGPNVINGLDYSDDSGKATYPAQSRIMPYEEAKRLLMQAASDYPKADFKAALASMEKQYKGTYTGATGTPTAANWMGEATNDKNQLYLAAQSGDPMAQRLIKVMQGDELAQAKAKAENSRQVIVNNPLPSKMSMNELSAEGNAALAAAIAENRLDPYKVNSKNQQLLAATAIAHPGINLNNIAAELGVARNKDVIMKAGIAEMIPNLLAETVKAGQALKYSDAKFAGGVQRWMKGQLNDPKLVEYMTLRNDQLLTLGGVMRSNGMTDMAQRLEEEAAHPTLSPKALEGWLNGQLKSIDPRLSLYRNLTKGNTAIPRSSYTPGDGAQKLLNSEGGRGGKTVVKRFVSPSTGKTKLVYSDGSEEVR